MALFVSKQAHCMYDLLAHYEAGDWNVEIPLIISNHPDLEHVAKKFNIPYYYFPITKENKEEQEAKEMALLKEYNITFSVLAKYMQIISPEFIKAYPNNIINIHHSLLPKHGGKGMYGDNVHKAVVENKETESGITIHFLNERFDEGEQIAQYKCEVLPTDTPDDVATKVHALEYEWYQKVIEQVLLG